MALYEWVPERDSLGIPQIDDAHRELARLSGMLRDGYARGARKADMRETVRRFSDILLRHFCTEERLLAGLAPTAAVIDHIRRHRANHDYFRNAVAYLAHKFDCERDRTDLPNIIPIIPEQYFAELKGLDAEMGALMKDDAPAMSANVLRDIA